MRLEPATYFISIRTLSTTPSRSGCFYSLFVEFLNVSVKMVTIFAISRALGTID